MRALGALAIALAAVPALAAPTPGVYVALGDSITAGFDDDCVCETSGYPGYLLPLLQATDPDASVVNSGKSGEQSGQGLSRLPDVINIHQPQTVLIMEGINDLRKGYSSSSVAFNLQLMTTICRNRGVIPILATIIPGDVEVSRSLVDAVNAQLVPFIQSSGGVVGYAPAYDTFAAHPEYYGGLHPNQAGYQALASVFHGAIVARGDEPPPPFEGNGGDVDGNGRVDGLDLIRLALAFGSQVGYGNYDPGADVNLDGVVDGNDLSLLAANFGRNV